MYSRVSVFEKLLRSLPRPLFETILISGIAFSILIVTNFQPQNFSVITGLGLMAAAGLRLIPTFNIISSFLQSFNFNYPSFERIKQLCDSDKNQAYDFRVRLDLLNDLDVSSATSICFDKFTLKNKKKLILDTPILIEKGRINSIIGPSGSGKSSILEAIVGISPYNHGFTINIDNKLLSPSDILSFRKNVAYCPQKVDLVHGNLIDNIVLNPLLDFHTESHLHHSNLDLDRLQKCLDDVDLNFLFNLIACLHVSTLLTRLYLEVNYKDLPWLELFTTKKILLF